MNLLRLNERLIMSKIYPNISRSQKFDRWPSSIRCVACDNSAKFKVTIETNIFRGDDEQVKACEQHKNDLQAIYTLAKG